MDRIALTLHSNYHGNTEIGLFPGEEDNENGYLNIPSGQELIYNDNEYTFSVSGLNTIPSKVYINDEAYDVMPIHIDSETIKFRLKDCNSNRPFLNSFGAVKIEIVTNNLTVISKSIKVMVSNTAINNGVMNMIQYIYDKCEDYLYEEHKYSSISTGVKNSEIISLEAKISLLEKIMSTYKQAYHYLKVNPHSKLVKSEKIDSFDKLQSVTPNMIRYTVGHIDELVPVNYNTGIRYNKQFYQPDKTLIEYNSYTADVYENEVIVGFLYK